VPSGFSGHGGGSDGHVGNTSTPCLRAGWGHPLLIVWREYRGFDTATIGAIGWPMLSGDAYLQLINTQCSLYSRDLWHVYAMIMVLILGALFSARITRLACGVEQVLAPFPLLPA